MTELGQPDRELTPNGSARRRYLAILFTDLTDSARLVASMEAEDYAALLGRVRREYEETISRHGGTIIQIVGDGLLASFGYPEAAENDGRRATEAALELHEVIGRVPLPGQHRTPLSLHTGIHAGLVLLGEGDAVSGQLRLFGNPVNVAARLSDAAAGGEILVSTETLGAERHFFETRGEFRLPLQGMDQPVAVCRIVGRSEISTRFEARNARGLTPLAGRQSELQRLMAGVVAIRAGGRDAVSVIAPAGLGKTRLAEEFIDRARDEGCRVLRGYCESYLSAEPMQPFRQMLRQLCQLTYAMPPMLAAVCLRQAILEVDPGLEPAIPQLLQAMSLGGHVGDGKPERPNSEKMLAAIVRVIDTLAVTDAERRRAGVETLDGIRARLARVNGTAEGSLEPAPERAWPPAIKVSPMRTGLMKRMSSLTPSNALVLRLRCKDCQIRPMDMVPCAMMPPIGVRAENSGSR